MHTALRKNGDLAAEASQAASSDRKTFLLGVRLIEALVESQTQDFKRRSLAPPPVDPTFLRSVALLEQSGATASDRLSFLVRMLEEVSRRQRRLEEQDFAPGGEISLEAFIGAAHKIRTALDVTLNCSGEISEIVAGGGALEEIAAPAADAARAARWAAKYAEELSDLALLGQEDAPARQRFSGLESLRGVAAKLKPLAQHSDIALVIEEGADHVIFCDQARLERCLHYLLVWALDGRGVRTVRAHLAKAESGVVFVIDDDGLGASLVDRAAGTLQGDANSTGALRTADAAGYAMARRMAFHLNGAVTLTTTTGRGARIEFTLPQGAA